MNRIKTGAATLMIVIVVFMIFVFTLVAFQSRVFLSLYRNRALSDVVKVNYNAESEINDILAKFLGDYPNAFSYDFETPPETLWDGTVIKIYGHKDLITEEESLRVVATRPFATSEFLITRSKSSEVVGLTKADIVFTLDCTGSMGKAACLDTAVCGTDASPIITRMDVLKDALQAFMTRLDSIEGHENVKVGLSVFTFKTDWVYTSYDADGTPQGNPINPDLAVPLTSNQINTYIDNYFGRSGEEQSLACKKILKWTNVGGGLSFLHNYFDGRNDLYTDRKQIEILISDGQPNQRTQNYSCRQFKDCPRLDYCSLPGVDCFTYGIACGQHGWEYMSCAVASTEQTWQPVSFSVPQINWPNGIRDKNVDLYALTVYDPINPYFVSELTRNLGRSEDGGKWYSATQAMQMPDMLDTILDDIVESLYVINVGKVIPTPVR